MSEQTGFFANLFGGGQAASQAPNPAPTQAPADTSAQAAQVGQQQMQQATGGQPAGPAASAVPQGLDLLTSILQNKGTEQATPAFQIPQDKMSEIANGLDFAGGISPEAMQALQAGDLSKLPEILNSVGRQAYSTALDHSMRVTDKHLGDRFTSHSASMSAANRQQMVTSQLNLDDMHPMAQSMFKDVSSKLASQFPDASAKDIEGQAWRMMEELGSQFNRTQRTAAKQAASQEVDWDSAAGFKS